MITAVGLAHLSREGKWIRVNGKLCEILGYTEAEFRDRNFLEITHPEDRQENQKLFQRLIHGDLSSYVYHKRLLRKDQSVVWARVTTALQHDENNQFLYCISVIEDISAEREMEERLRQSEAHLRYATEEIGIGVWEYRLDEQRVIKSPNLAKLLGISPEEMSEDHDFLEKRIHPDDLQAEIQLVEHHDQFLRILDAFPEMLYVVDPEDFTILFANRKFEETPGGNVSGLICHETLHGLENPCPFCTNEQLFGLKEEKTLQWEHYFPEAEKYFQITDQLISWTDGRKVRLEIANDITEERLLQKQFIQSQRMEGIGTLAGGIAHDLNNILAPILISTEMLLKRENLDARSREYLEIVHKSSQRGADVVRQLLTFARGQGGKEDVFQPQSLVKEMVRMIRETFPRNITIEYDIEEARLSMRGDPSQLQQVLLNLCVNARDAMPEGGHLKLRVFRRDSASSVGAKDSKRPLGLSVSDTGCGMSTELQANIFDPFFTTKETGNGTGLGLSTAAGIVKSLGGEIVVRSSPDQGATFTLWFPEVPGASPDLLPEERDEEEEMDPGKGESILLVDDEETILQTLSDSLWHAGYKVETAKDGMEALEKFKNTENNFDLLVTDSNMPKMNGLQLVEKVREINPGVPYLFITGRADQSFCLKDSEIPREHILEKPFFPEKLLNRIRNILDTVAS